MKTDINGNIFKPGQLTPSPQFSPTATTTGGSESPNALQSALKSMPSAEQTTVSKSMTSAGMLDQILSKESPLMRRASTQGSQQAQSRGLLNSSMAAGASQGAMIDRAQPFAINDSNNLIQNAQRNTDAKNQRGLLQMGLIGDSYKSNQNYTQQRGLNDQAYGFEKELNQQQQGFTQSNWACKTGFSKAR